MNLKSFYLNGLLVEIHSNTLPESRLRLTVHLNGNKIKDSDIEIPEAEFDETAERIEQMLRDNLST